MKYLVYLLLLANLGYLGWNIHLNQKAGEAVRELPPLPDGVSPLVTLQELEKQQEHADEISGLDALTNAQPPGAGVAHTCQTLGPFLVEEELQAVARQLEQQGVAVRRRTAEVQKPNGFWVYLPAMEREQVLQAVNKLEENGDREYYVGKGNFLALGTFKEISRAEIRLEETRELGFDPVLEARYDTSTEYWLDIDTQMPAADILDAILQEHPALQLQGTACP